MEFFFAFLMVVIVYHIMIPIALYISMELVRVSQVFFMIRDDIACMMNQLSQDSI